jgi:hypothetical protein
MRTSDRVGFLPDPLHHERPDEPWRRSGVLAITTGAVEGAPSSTTAGALA